MNLNASLVPMERRIADSLESVKNALTQEQPWEALKHITDLERELDLKSVHDWNDARTGPTAASAVTWCYYRGVCFGMLERHDEALTVGNEMSAVFPEFAEGFYLAGMAAAAKKDFDAARSLLEQARETDAQRRGPEKSKQTSKLITTRIKALQHEHIRKLLRRHSDLVQSVCPSPCSRCGFQPLLPTPRWLCPRCFTEDRVESHLWQSDDVGCCHACNVPLGTGSRHHCRSCGKLCCAPCSKHSSLVSLLGYHSAPVRICSPCHNHLVSEGPCLPNMRVRSENAVDALEVAPGAAREEEGGAAGESECVSTRSSVFSSVCSAFDAS